MNDLVTQPKSAIASAAPKQRAATPSGPALHRAPSHEDIARRAYDIYLKKGRHQGQCQQDWQQAERELRN